LAYFEHFQDQALKVYAVQNPTCGVVVGLFSVAKRGPPRHSDRGRWHNASAIAAASASAPAPPAPDLAIQAALAAVE